MEFYPVFLSVIFVVRNRETELEGFLSSAIKKVSPLVTDFELIVVDNASEDNSVHRLNDLTSEAGLENLQIFSLAQQVESDVANWVGLENALGDVMVVIDPVEDSIEFLPAMLAAISEGADVAFAKNLQKSKQSWLYNTAASGFNYIYKWTNGVHLNKDAPKFRALTRRVVNYLLQYPQPVTNYRHLPVTAGFSRKNLEYHAHTPLAQRRSLFTGFERAVRLMVSTTHAPMRIVTTFSLFGAISNLLYSVYVLITALIKTDVAPGWVSMSLQQSGMFFLLSMVLWVLGEYILNIVRQANEGPLYHVAQEFTSAHMTRREKLNLEEVAFDSASRKFNTHAAFGLNQ